VKVTSPKDSNLNNMLYIAIDGIFNSGHMLVGEFKGKPVKEVKNLIQSKIIRFGHGVVYYEPSEVTMSRAGDECVIATGSSWVVRYDEPQWKKTVRE
jgi:leucyl-tRNA synthetase